LISGSFNAVVKVSLRNVLLSQIRLTIVIKTMKHTSDILHLSAENKICKPQKYTQVFLVNVTLEKPPREKPVKRNLLGVLKEEITVEISSMLHPTYLKFGSKFLLGS
jgi:ribosomal protein L31